MKTDVKNGAFIYGVIPVDTATINIGDAYTKEGVNFCTGADGLFPIIAETDGNGTVKSLIIDMSNVTQYLITDTVTIIDEEDILVKDGQLYDCKDEFEDIEE